MAERISPGDLVHLKGFIVPIDAIDEGPDVVFELAGRTVHAALQLLARQFGEQAFDLIDPRRRGRRKVGMPVRPPRQPDLHRCGLMGGVVVHDDVDVQPLGDTAVDLFREPGTKRLEQAAAAYQEALSLSSRERNPLEWAATQSNFGSALLALGRRESSRQRLDEAVEVLRAAIEVLMRERAPLQWGTTKQNLGNALSALGEREPVSEGLEQAADVLREALEELTRKRVPLDWATAQTNLGNTLLMLGRPGSDTKQVQDAIDAYRAVLQVRTRGRVPFHWPRLRTTSALPWQRLARCR